MTKGETAVKGQRGRVQTGKWVRNGVCGSPSRARTYNLAVNSRPLYH